MINLTPQPLSKAAFAAFGEVIETEGAAQIAINNGITTRFHDLFTIDAGDGHGRPILSIFRSAPLALPHRPQKLERHPLGSQAFLPMDEIPFLILVATDAATITPARLSLFISNGRQGINLYKNVWHHTHIVLEKQRDFFVIDRAGPGNNLQEIDIQGEVWIAPLDGIL